MYTRVAFQPLGLALLAILSNLVISTTAQAQFVCGGSADGSGGGAMAGGSVRNFACGTSANASGNRSANTATGTHAMADGDRSNNVATGTHAN